jgi:hypothetical protein
LSGAVVVMKLILIVIIVAIVPPTVQKYYGWRPTMPPIQKRVDVVTPSWTIVAMIAARKKAEAALMARKKFEVCHFLIWKFCKKVAQPNKYFFAAIFFQELKEAAMEMPIPIYIDIYSHKVEEYSSHDSEVPIRGLSNNINRKSDTIFFILIFAMLIFLFLLFLFVCWANTMLILFHA